MKIQRDVGKGGKKPGSLKGVTQQPGKMPKSKPVAKDNPISAPGVPGGPVPGVRGPRPASLGIRGNMKPRPGKYKS